MNGSFFCVVGCLLFSFFSSAKTFPTGVKTDQSLNIQVLKLDNSSAAENLPTSWDWRKVDGQNWMTPVRSQNGCGSCVAFGAASTLEIQMKIASGFSWWQPLVSVQSMFACGGGNCSQGWIMEQAAQNLKTVGVPDEACSPYVAQSGAPFCQNCTDHHERRVYTLESKQISFGTMDPLVIKRALLHGPVWALMIIYDDFYEYKFGVYKNQTGKPGPGHTLAIIGYDDSKKAWLVKNSWGEEWGGKGYGMIHYNDISGLGMLAYSLIMPGDSHYVSIQGLNQGDVLVGQKNIQMFSIRKDISEYVLDIETAQGKLVDQLSCKKADCQIQLDTNQYANGEYLFRPTAITEKSEKIKGWVVAGKIQNNRNPSNLSIDSIPDANIKGLGQWNLSNPLLANHLLVRVYKNNQLVQKRDIKDLPAHFQLRWDTRSLQNGSYQLQLSYQTSSSGVLINSRTQISNINISN